MWLIGKTLLALLEWVNMNEEKLKQINRISEEITKIERFIEREFRTPVAMSILGIEKKKRRLLLRANGYGIYNNFDYKVPNELTGEVLKVIRDYREKLIDERDKLWGS